MSLFLVIQRLLYQVDMTKKVLNFIKGESQKRDTHNKHLIKLEDNKKGFRWR